MGSKESYSSRACYPCERAELCPQASLGPTGILEAESQEGGAEESSNDPNRDYAQGDGLVPVLWSLFHAV